MLLAEPIKHTDALSQARFVSMTLEQQMLEIWLNTRETNGHVADALAKIADIQDWREGEMRDWQASVDRRLIGAAAVLAFILVMAPFVFFALGKYT